MAQVVRALVGRDREIRQLDAALDDAAAGHGSLVLLEGEAGIGKSRLVEETARRAAERGAEVLWGRCWEAGGAPAFWPWIQLLRGLFREREARALLDRLGPGVAHLQQLMPELRAPRAEADAPPSLGPEQARFQLLDAVARVLSDAAVRAPLVVILEDLHTADPASLDLLEFLAQHIKGTRLCLFGTYRDADRVAFAAADVLGRLARQVQTLVLSRLGLDDVEQLVASEWPELPVGPLARTIHTTTEGNPLFISEVLRLLAQRGDAQRVASTGQFVLPRGVQATLTERLATLEPGTRAVLSRAAVIGREFSNVVLQQAFGLRAGEVSAALEDAEARAVVQRVTPSTCRFSHVLFRDVLYASLEDDQRWERHAAVAAHLERVENSKPERSWEEIAHHCDRAGPRAPVDPPVALVRAADAAIATFAFGDAVVHYRRALELLRESEREHERIADDVLLGLGRAQLSVGDLDAGRAACQQVADRARRRGEPALLARAALQYGSVFIFADVDDRLVALLREALDALGESDPGLTALVMSRLAAAMQPSGQPERLFDLARQAVAIAREVGDRGVLLGTMRSACSTLADLADPTERAVLNREYVELARSLGEGSEVLRGQFRLIFDHVELGEIGEVQRALDAADQLAEQLSHPLFQWRVAAFRTALALWHGRFDEAKRLRATAEELAQRSGDPTAPRALLLQKIETHILRGELERARSFVPEIRSALTTSGGTWAFGALYSCACLTRAGRVGEARAILTADLLEQALRLRDGSVYDALSIIAVGLEDADLAERVEDHWGKSPPRFVSGGMTAMWFGGPTTRSLARLAAVQGDHERALELLERALEEARSVGSRPHVVWVAIEYADLARRAALPRAGDTERRQRARALLDESRSLVAAMGAPFLEAALQERRSTAADVSAGAQPGVGADTDSAGGAAFTQREGRPEGNSSRGTLAFALIHEGDYWTIRAGADEFRLRDIKGLQIVDRLVKEPEREFHVLDLSSSGASALAGDSGELLDEQAKASYKTRVAELREQLDQANQWNDLARAERVQGELDALARELSRAVGLGGRARRAGSAVERARVNVQRRIRDAIRRIERESPELARHLDRSIRTGAYCSYCPE